MARAFTRDEVRARLHETLATTSPILVVGAGIGLTAKFAERGGADLIAVYNSGRFRMNGIGSSAGNLALDDANRCVVEMGERIILPVVNDVPVIAGVYGIDPTRDMKVFLPYLASIGFSGVINYPTVGRIDGNFREDLEHMGLGYGKEVEMIRVAASLGLFTMAYVFTPEEAELMAEVDADAVVAHMGLTREGDVGARNTISLDEAEERTERILQGALKKKQSVIPLCHGGPIATPDDVKRVMSRTCARGFVAASSVERIPVERAIEETVRAFKSVRRCC